MNAKNHRGPDRTVLPLLCTAILLAAVPAHAGDTLLLAGSEGGGGGNTSYYNFLGAVAPLPGNNFGNGFMQKYKVDFQGYDYRGSKGDVTATAVGVDGSVGYQKSSERGWIGGYGGVRYSNTWLSPDDPGSRVRGSQVRPLLQVDAERELSADWRVGALGSYVFISDSYWSRGRVMYRVRDDIYTGPEFTAQGDPAYRAWGGGWFVTGLHLFGGSIGVKAGVRQVEKIDPGIYLGLEYSQMLPGSGHK